MTDAECEALYGEICNHQRDIEYQGQQNSVVCDMYPLSATCIAVQVGIGNVASVYRSTFYLEEVQTNIQQLCWAYNEGIQNGFSLNEIFDMAFEWMVNDGGIPNTQLEYDLQYIMNMERLNHFCPSILNN